METKDALDRANNRYKYAEDLNLQDKIPITYKHPRTMRNRKGIGIVFDVKEDKNSPHMVTITAEVVGLGYFTVMSYPKDYLFELSKK